MLMISDVDDSDDFSADDDGMMMAMIWKKNLLLVLGVSVSLLGINNAESESSSGGLDTVNISLIVQIGRSSDF